MSKYIGIKLMSMKRLMLKFVSILVLLSIKMNLFAYDFEVDGLCYNKKSDTEVEVTYRSGTGGDYSGNLIIPTTTTYNGTKYIVTSIGKRAFAECSGLTGELSIPNSVISIDSWAFYGCSGLKGDIIIPNSVTTIGEYAFSDCIGFDGSLQLPSNLTTIEKRTFNNCCFLKGQITLPNSITKIGDYAFYRCSSLTGNINFPKSIVSIGAGAFSGCIGLTGDLSIPNSVTNIGRHAFSECVGFDGYLTLSTSLTTIDEGVFYNCSKLKGSLVIPNTVTTIGHSAFRGCTGFGGTLSLSSSLMIISDWAFYGCSALKGNLSIPNSVTKIGKSAFGLCSGFDGNIIIPNSLTTIGQYSFYECRGFNGRIVLPNSITSLELGAFSGCRNIVLVDSYIENPFEIANSVFELSNDAILQVPSQTINKYKELSGWSKPFKEIKERESVISSYTLSIIVAGNGSASYDGTNIRSKTSTFTVNEGTNATISFSADNGYRIKSVKVNSTNVTSSVSNNQYTVSNIKSNTTVEVEFEAIPPTTYTLSIKATGNGSVSYDGTTIRSKTSTFTINEGTNATISFSADNGYRMKSVNVNSSDVTSSVSNNQYTVSNIRANTTLEADFEVIPAGIDITQYVSAVSIGGSIMQTNNLINSGSQLNWTFSNKSSESVTLNSLQLIDGQSGTAGNIMSVNQVVNANSSVSYTTTIGAAGIHTPVTCRFRYTYNGNEYSTDAKYTGSQDYTLYIKSTGNGQVKYNGNIIRNTTESYSVDFLSSVTLTITPDDGYKIKSVKVNNSDVTSRVSNNSYTISLITSNQTIEVEFELATVNTYTLSIKATGNGFVSYNGTTIRSKTNAFTVNEGTAATMSFSPDETYMVKSVKVNGSDVASRISNNSYTINNISSDTSVEVEFEINPIFKEIEEKMSEITKKYDTAQSKLEEFTNALKKSTIDDSSKRAFENNVALYSTSLSVLKAQMDAIAAQYDKIKSSEATDRELTDLITKIDNVNSTLDDINKAINENYEKFISISNRTYTLSIKVTGNGAASYDGNSIRGRTSTFKVNEGTSATISFNPDNGYRVKSVKVNSSDVTSNLSNYKYTINNINKNTDVEVEFQEELKIFTSGGLNYAVLSYDDKTVSLANGKYGMVLEVPATITYQDITWKVAGIDNAALANNEELAAIIWNPSAAFTVSVSNPNLLLYVKSASYAPATIKNIVVNSTAEDIVLTDAASGNNFYCPKEFTAKKISYTHNYGMITGLGECRGWETIALPFDVKKIAHSSKGELTPFANWRSGDSKKPFWLMSYGTGGWANANSIKANTPYIISMPNNPDYKAEFRLSGNITFSSENVTVKKSDNLQTVSYDGNTFTPNYSNTDNSGYLALNVNNDYVSYTGGSAEGSTFVVNLRPVHPFEAYMTSTSKTRSTISINGDMATGIEDLSALMDESKGLRIYDLKGQLIKVEQDKGLDEVRRYLPSGVYIVNGKKLIIK